MFFDIHSHVLHKVDDGAKNLKESINLLKMMYSQGITHVLATPHFYPQIDTLDGFLEKVGKNFQELQKECQTQKVPNIYKGSEVFYYSGISKASGLEKLTLGGSDYILIEPNFNKLGVGFQKELLYFRDTLKITPIIAHLERYRKVKGYKNLLKFIKQNNILVQVNASSFLSFRHYFAIKKLVKMNIITFIGTDTHSIEHRPPQLSEALQIIEKRFGAEYKEKLICNSNEFLQKITQKGN
ncbi:MAG: hypothetical protein E7537_00870 [Ruminococcaceae bacterium]|nr:hypothetical protein [Oscillospiraceae bacterium]